MARIENPKQLDITLKAWTDFRRSEVLMRWELAKQGLKPDEITRAVNPTTSFRLGLEEEIVEYERWLMAKTTPSPAEVRES